VPDDFRIGSLFSGIGLLDLAIELVTGGRTVWQVEKNAWRRDCVLARRFPHATRHADVCTTNATNLEPVDIVIGGFPCQDVSDAGRREGLKGDKSGLWWEYARILAELRPPLAFIENVQGLVRRGLVDVLAELGRLGYSTRRGRLAASDVGAPHGRERVWIMAYADSERLRQFAERIERVATARWHAIDLDDRASRSVADSAGIGCEVATHETSTTASSKIRRRARPATPGTGAGVADTGHGGCEGLGSRDDHDRGDAPWHDDARRRALVILVDPDWPPGRDADADTWIDWLARNPGCEPGVRRAAHGSAGRLDRRRRKRRLAALGDAVCVHQAATALRTLATAQPEVAQMLLLSADMINPRE
jgi:DNA (cytosine-5)-methyltransferase 1